MLYCLHRLLQYLLFPAHPDMHHDSHNTLEQTTWIMRARAKRKLCAWQRTSTKLVASNRPSGKDTRDREGTDDKDEEKEEDEEGELHE